MKFAVSVAAIAVLINAAVCPTKKADYNVALNKPSAWNAYMKATKCHSTNAESLRVRRNTLVKAWFDAVAVAGKTNSDLTAA